ncbi:MAG: hypothetical protein HYU37_12860 [Acidobacteria bacterium]|nr:hypothetical protein [Acidobacteriota bacterium]
MRAQRGMSLVEASIILSVVAVLSAVLSPAINGYIEQARQARTREDVQTIAEAIQDFIEDNAEHQFLRNASNGSDDSDPPTRADTNRVDLLVSDGDVPTLATAVSTESYWTQAVNSTTVDTLANHLIDNAPLSSDGTSQGTTRYRHPTDVSVASPGGNNIDFARTDSSGSNAPYAWRGPYLRSPADPDPWGNRYTVNVAFLDPSPTDTVSNITSGWSASDYYRLDVFVLSAGADEEIDTKSAQDGAVPGDDDFIYLVSSHAK